jgi:hypothetical protein
MNEQSYTNHTRWVKGYHFILSMLLIAGLIGSIINAFHQPDQSGLFSALLLVIMFFSSLFIFWFMRLFALKAQDRAIRAEEHLRYFILTGKPISNRITMGQIIALRFAPDDEFVLLVDKAVTEGLSAGDIKKAIKVWRTDNHRA